MASEKHEIFETSTALQIDCNKHAQLIPLYRDLRREPRAVAHGFGMCATDADEAPSPLVTPDERSPDVVRPIGVNAEQTAPAVVSKPDKSRIPKSYFWLRSQ